MATMMTDRVLLVCALCVLWCAIAGIAAGCAGAANVSAGEYLALRFITQMRRECEEEVSRRTEGRANASAVEECVREGMDGLRAVVDGRRRWRRQRYALVAENAEDVQPKDVSVGTPLPLPGQETQGPLQDAALEIPGESSKGGAGGGAELVSKQLRPEEPPVTKQNESAVEGELMSNENNSEPEENVSDDSHLTNSNAMKVPENQPEADSSLLSSSGGRAAGIPGQESSEFPSKVSRSSEASGIGGDGQYKNTNGAAKPAVAAPKPVSVTQPKPSGIAGAGEGERLEDPLPETPVKETAPAAPSPKASSHTASSPSKKKETESTKPADGPQKKDKIPTTAATQNATTEGHGEATSSSSAADDSNAVTNNADEGNVENSNDGSASRAAVPDEKQQREREDGSEKETESVPTPKAKNEDPGSADAVSVQQVQNAQSGREPGSESRKEDGVVTTNKQQDGASDSHAESTPTSRSSAKRVAVSNGPDKATEEEISNKRTTGVDAVPEAAQEDGNKDDSTKELPIKTTAIANDTAPTGDSDGSTAISHTTFPLLLLLLVACAAAAAVVAA
ncbi:mucin-associated surface protein [Trypanosoma cruzi cruzi]|uniref:Mucin-associated surface protein (MASP) n=1 Tax=Trypanosoma cruzi TaxID=5693 RepID=A0A2V2V3J6_TRYCR|nr:mucin-associated surface protein [Trypanosoma cruzi cruzi]PWU90102.1 Mucin-associated surface protein (MASP) [Trypanosoma cruzi]